VNIQDQQPHDDKEWPQTSVEAHARIYPSRICWPMRQALRCWSLDIHIQDGLALEQF